MDRFIFHNSQYKILDTVRDMPWVGVPLPFAECIFYFADMGLQVSTAVCKSRTCLSMCFAMISDGKPVVFASVNAALNNGRWPRQIDLSFVSGRGAPPESIYEFIRFYQRLSIYLAQPKPKRQVSEKEVKAKDLGMAIERMKRRKKRNRKKTVSSALRLSRSSNSGNMLRKRGAGNTKNRSTPATTPIGFAATIASTVAASSAGLNRICGISNSRRDREPTL